MPWRVLNCRGNARCKHLLRWVSLRIKQIDKQEKKYVFVGIVFLAHTKILANYLNWHESMRSLLASTRKPFFPHFPRRKIDFLLFFHLSGENVGRRQAGIGVILHHPLFSIDMDGFSGWGDEDARKNPRAPLRTHKKAILLFRSEVFLFPTHRCGLVRDSKQALTVVALSISILMKEMLGALNLISENDGMKEGMEQVSGLIAPRCRQGEGKKNILMAARRRRKTSLCVRNRSGFESLLRHLASSVVCVCVGATSRSDVFVLISHRIHKMAECFSNSRQRALSQPVAVVGNIVKKKIFCTYSRGMKTV